MSTQVFKLQIRIRSFKVSLSIYAFLKSLNTILIVFMKLENNKIEDAAQIEHLKTFSIKWPPKYMKKKNLIHDRISNSLPYLNYLSAKLTNCP